MGSEIGVVSADRGCTGGMRASGGGARQQRVRGEGQAAVTHGDAAQPTVSRPRRCVGPSPTLTQGKIRTLENRAHTLRAPASRAAVFQRPFLGRNTAQNSADRSEGRGDSEWAPQLLTTYSALAYTEVHTAPRGQRASQQHTARASRPGRELRWLKTLPIGHPGPCCLETAQPPNLGSPGTGCGRS